MSRNLQRIGFLVVAILAVMVTAYAIAQETSMMVHTTSFDGISFYFADDYAQNVSISHYAGDPPEGGAPGFTEAPYTEFVLYRDVMAPYSLFDTGGMRIYHLADLSMYDFMQPVVDQLQAMLQNKPDLEPYMDASDQTSMPLPFLPILTHGQVIRARAHYIETDTLHGIAYLFASQAAVEPFMDTSFIYTFQGITTDDQFYVSLIVPVKSNDFPAELDANFDMTTFQASLPGYNSDSVATLNASSDTAFMPDLSLLDAIAESIAFESMEMPTATFTPTPTLLTPTPSPCQIPSGWVRYTVVRGDTLANIASRVNSTVTSLAQANCIADVNRIVVGQQIYVPMAIPTATAAPHTEEVGLVNILPFVNGPLGVAELDRGATVTFVWNEAPRDAASVQFILLDPHSERSQVLAIDNTPADGARADWVVPDQLDGLIMAIAYRSDQSPLLLSLARAVVSRPPIAQFPLITTFRLIAVGPNQAVEWQTQNVGMVNIVWNGPDGAPGGSLVQQPANGTMPLPELGPEFAPYATFYLFAMDANGQEIRDPYAPENVLSAQLTVKVANGVIFTGGPNPATAGSTVTLTWSAPGTQSMAISRSRAAEQGYDIVQDGLPASGDLVVMIPSEYSHVIEFVLYPSGTDPFANGIGSYHITILPAASS